MFRIKFIFSFIVIFFFHSVVLTAQNEENSSAINAVKVLKGIDTHISKLEAISSLKSLANKGNTYSMNALGMAYMYGIGIEIDTTKAKFYLSNAGEKGNVEAYHNLGMIYKNAVAGISQNFKEACYWFGIGASRGSVMCSYDLGFMLYKGLGCHQNYVKAVDCFQMAADHDYAPALYMLGLCFRNGYGVEKNEEQAMYYLKRAGKLGYEAAWEEIKRKNSENQLEKIDCSSFVSDFCEFDTMHIAGNYQGIMTLHDWSNKYILAEKPINVSIKKSKNRALCEFNIDKQTIRFHTHIDSLRNISLENSQIKLGDRYSRSESKVNYDVNNICFTSISDNIAKGTITLYSQFLQEPERPISFTLYKNVNYNDKSTNEGEQNKIVVTPNPFDDHFTISLELPQKVNEVVLRIYNQLGVLVQTQKLGSFEEGKHAISINTILRKGNYVLNIKADHFTFKSIITKK